MLANNSENRLTHLLGAYNSDSDNENEEEAPEERKNGMNADNNTLYTEWTQCFDRDSGHPYFWNIQTKEVTWEMPQEYSTYLEWVKSSKFSHEQRWKVYEAEDTKTPYYVDEVTRIVFWEMPEEYKKGLASHEKEPVKEVRKEPQKEPQKVLKKVEKKVHKTQAKKYPEHLTNYNSDDEKIELISSYGRSSDSSEDECESTEGQGEKSRTTAIAEHSATLGKKTKIEAYREDEKSSEKPPEPIPSEELLPYKLYSHDPNDHHATDKTVNTTGSSILFSNETSVTLSELERTYQADREKSKSPENLPGSDANKMSEKSSISNMEIDMKLTMRKRRIEIPRIPPKTEQISKPETDQDDSGSSENKPKGSLYENFQKGGVEFADKKDEETESEEKQIETTTKDASTDTATDDEQSIEEVKELSSLIGAKVKFLSEGRPIISGVQIMQIQLETLLAAFDTRHLSKHYIMNWLSTTTKSLLQLENDVAPNGWKCKWDRENSRYYYQNLATGRIQWDFPEPDVTCAGDEMEICTTPPYPGASETEVPIAKKAKLSEDSGDELRAPEPPAWNSSPEPPPAPMITPVPPPPPVITNKLNLELDYFYSDLASLETSMKPPPPEVIEEAPAADVKKTTKPEVEPPPIAPSPKVKKKKVKTSKTDMKEVSLMMAKWQKAQQDLQK
uniref:WW domain-containing protein n=1 Tax=Lutzomyia longipalpis TaxID=7200 RepID=A0A1B0CFG1_LUTLO